MSTQSSTPNRFPHLLPLLLEPRQTCQLNTNLFLNRLPKKLGESILKQHDPNRLHLGWGIHIVEGPDWSGISWATFAIMVSSFVVSLTYDLVAKQKDSGFGIGQWMVAVLSAALSGLYFSLAEA
jgi:hypothetical protein